MYVDYIYEKTRIIHVFTVHITMRTSQGGDKSISVFKIAFCLFIIFVSRYFQLLWFNKHARSHKTTHHKDRLDCIPKNLYMAYTTR